MQMFKKQGYDEPCDITNSISLYWKHLEDHEKKLERQSIKFEDDEKIMAAAAAAAMWNSEFFAKEKLLEWEMKVAADQTWAAV